MKMKIKFEMCYYFLFFKYKIMLNYITNNFILAAILSLLVTIFVYFQKRLEDDKNNKDNPKKITSNVLFYGKLFVIVYLLTLTLLLFKTKDYSLPFKMKGGSSKEAPWSEHNISTNTTEVSAPSLTNDLELKEVDIGEPKF